MLFKLDENMAPDFVDLFRRHGHDAVTVEDQRMRGRGDRDIAEVCRGEGRAVVTLDVGFADIRAYPPEPITGSS